jgi:hypothetical protein
MPDLPLVLGCGALGWGLFVLWLAIKPADDD